MAMHLEEYCTGASRQIDPELGNLVDMVLWCWNRLGLNPDDPRLNHICDHAEALMDEITQAVAEKQIWWISE